MKYISIVNFEEHQHYKNREIVVWIKLYTKLLTSYKLFQLTAEERWCFIALLLLAPAKKNQILCDFSYFSNFFAIKHTKKVEKVIKKLEHFKLIEIKNSRHSLDKVYAKERREEKRRKEKSFSSSKNSNILKAKEKLRKKITTL